jgi:hypothetical protein
LALRRATSLIWYDEVLMVAMIARSRRPARGLAAGVEAAPGLLSTMMQSGKLGAGLGVLQGAGEHSKSWGDKAEGAIEGGLWGGVGGFVLPGLLSGAGKLIGGAYNTAKSLAAYPFSGGKKLARQQAAAKEMEDLGVPPSGPVVAENSLLYGAARGAAGNIVGAPLRSDLAATATAAERGIADLVGKGKGTPDPAMAGEEAQDTLRRGLYGHSERSDQLDLLPTEELEKIAQPARRGPAEPADDYGQARGTFGSGVRPEAEESYPTQFGAQYRLAERTPVEGYGTAAKIKGNFLEQYPTSQYPVVQREVARVAMNRAQRAANEGNKEKAALLTPQEIDAIVDDWQFTKDVLAAKEPERLGAWVRRLGGVRDTGGDVRSMIGGIKGLPGMVNRKGNEVDKLATAAWEHGYFPHHTEPPSASDFLAALSDDLGGTRPIYAGPDAAFPEQRSYAQKGAEQLHTLGVWNKRTPEEVRAELEKQAAAARAKVRPDDAAAGIKPDRVTGPPMATYKLLYRFGEEARAAGRLKGWRGDIHDPQFEDMLRGRVGKDVAALLLSERDRIGTGQAKLEVPGLRQIRTSVREALEGAIEGGEGHVPSLQRLHGAMTEDLDTILRGAGPGGHAAAMAYKAADAEYTHYMESMRRPLQKLLGKKVSPDQAFRAVAKAMQSDTQDIKLLRAFMQTIRQKGGLEQANRTGRALIAPMLDEGLPGFVKAWRGVSEEAREVLAAHSSLGPMMDRLDRYATLAERMAKLQKAAAKGGTVSVGNMLTAALVLQLPGFLAGLGGAHMLARFMASPRYMRWLLNAPMRTVGGPASKAFKAYVTQLGAITDGDKELGKAVMGAVQSIAGNAQAGPMPPTIADRIPWNADEDAALAKHFSVWEEYGPLYSKDWGRGVKGDRIERPPPRTDGVLDAFDPYSLMGAQEEIRTRGQSERASARRRLH